MGAQQQLMELCCLNLDTLQPESPPDGETSQDYVIHAWNTAVVWAPAGPNCSHASASCYGVLAGELLLVGLRFADAASLLLVLMEYALN